MSQVSVQDEIVVRAPTLDVWEAIESVERHAGWHRFVNEIVGEHELGATRTCAVSVGKKAGKTTERCVEYAPPHRIAWLIAEDSTGFSRIASDWHAGFKVAGGDSGTLVTAWSTFRPRGPVLRLISPVVRRKFHDTQRAILAALKDGIESQNERR